MGDHAVREARRGHPTGAEAGGEARAPGSAGEGPRVNERRRPVVRSPTADRSACRATCRARLRRPTAGVDGVTDSDRRSARGADVTGKADFTDEEWTRLKRAPFVAGMAISL